jgi:hypothetical protein
MLEEKLQEKSYRQTFYILAQKIFQRDNNDNSFKTSHDEKKS